MPTARTRPSPPTSRLFCNASQPFHATGKSVNKKRQNQTKEALFNASLNRAFVIPPQRTFSRPSAADGVAVVPVLYRNLAALCIRLYLHTSLNLMACALLFEPYTTEQKVDRKKKVEVCCANSGSLFCALFKVPQNRPYCQHLFARFCAYVGGFGSRFSPSACTSRRFARFAGFWRGFRGVGCQHPAAILDALVVVHWAQIGPADLCAGESGVSFVGSRRAHISPQCGLNGVLGVFHFHAFLPPFSLFCSFSVIAA